MSGGLMSCGLKSGGLISGGLKSYDRTIYTHYVVKKHKYLQSRDVSPCCLWGIYLPGSRASSLPGDALQLLLGVSNLINF